MLIELDFSVLQRVLKEFKSLLSKSPLTKGTDDAKDIGALLIADSTTGNIRVEVAVKGFYLSAPVSGKVKDGGSVIVRVGSVTSLKYAPATAELSCGKEDKSIKLRAGKLKADIPIHHDVDDILSQKPERLESKHTIHINRLTPAIKCVELDSIKDDTLFARFVMGYTGLTVWSNSPSTAALYHNDKSPFEETLEVSLPVDLLSAYLSKVSGKIDVAVDSNVFQFSSDEMMISHPLKDADVFDIKEAVGEITSGDDFSLKFTSKISDTLECLSSIVGFAPEDMRVSLQIEPKKHSVACTASSDSGEGENSFSVDAVDGTSKTVNCSINCSVILKLLSSMNNFADDVTWFILSDRILLRSVDGTISYICAQME